MKFYVDKLDMLTTTPEVVVARKDCQISFNVSSFGRPSFNKFDVFAQINQYLSTLSEIDKDTLFGIYSGIRNTFDSVWEPGPMTIQLSKRVTELLDFFDYDSVNHWVLFSSNIFIPTDFKKEYISSIDRNGSREQTYLCTDYTKLVTLSLIMRVMIPVWGEFISRIRQDKGTTFKEYYAFQLLRHSKIINSEPFDKLRVYIDRTVGSEANSQNTIINGISSENFPEWILGLVAVRRLCIGDIRGTEFKANLVTFIYAFITQKTSGIESVGANIIKEKTFSDSSTDADAKLSMLERYKIKAPISIGEIVSLEVSIKDPREIAFRLSSSMTDALFNDAMASAQHLNNHVLLDPQMTLLRWIMKPVISPRGIMYLPKPTIVNYLGVCQAVLMARGHPYLALLCTSFADITDQNTFISGVDSRTRIPKDLIEELNILYPYFKRTGNKKTQIKPVNMTLNAIDILVSDLSIAVWNMTASNEHIAQQFGSGHSRRIPITPSVRVDIAKLIIELAKGNWK